jgi:glycosyltransferase involved in cell wall biosynthesis
MPNHARRGDAAQTSADTRGFSARDSGDGDLPAVTVVVPTRDRPLLLERAVRAILNQDYPALIDCVVVADQSDVALDTADVPPNRSVRVVANERRPGLPGARNTGLLAARHSLVAFCDDDDEWLPHKLRVQAALLAARADVSVISSGIYIRYAGRQFVRCPPRRDLTLEDFRRSRRMEVHSSTLLIRRNFFQRVGLIDEDIPGTVEDHDWLLRAARLSPVAAVREPLVRVYWDRPSWFERDWQTVAAAIVYLLGKHRDLGEDPKGLARFLGQLALAHAAAGESGLALTWARRCLRADMRQPRAYLALAVRAGLVSADDLLSLAHRFGRGI